ncbi:MAG TPA: SDR family oxidoreductase [Erysipelotrichaceae bacterium]|jgi:NAD(P)-dependent dehydrogenase (short-subunit alcohol dehydrogenase family)|nr:SDR family oxidoreductase [Erysipelotrichia bacterium]HPX32404.1 SDR family oxidoreductase [Erysipelotrichaceae bacterium]HQA85075.1 SDR family oxidoreductase [Erysipelotrichaceae bacterium]
MKQKLALVTGAGRGIGLETARLFLEHNIKTILVDIDEIQLDKAMEELNDELAISFVCDVTDEEKVNKLCNHILKEYGTVDILVNNAGIFRCDRGPFSNSISEHWRKKIDCNIYGTLYFTRALINPMIKQKYGSIINLSSITATLGAVGMVDYTLTKGAIKSFTKSLSKEVALNNVRVNSVSPGNIEPDNRYPEMSYMNRSGSYRECAQVIYFLASDEASFVTGEDYVVAGGRKKI